MIHYDEDTVLRLLEYRDEIKDSALPQGHELTLAISDIEMAIQDIYFTDKEKEIIVHINSPLKKKDLAKSLGLSLSTYKSSKEAIINKISGYLIGGIDG